MSTNAPTSRPKLTPADVTASKDTTSSAGLLARLRSRAHEELTRCWNETSNRTIQVISVEREMGSCCYAVTTELEQELREDGWVTTLVEEWSPLHGTRWFLSITGPDVRGAQMTDTLLTPSNNSEDTTAIRK